MPGVRRHASAAFVATAIFMITFSVSAFGQTISGTVKDTQNAAIRGAEVRVVSGISIRSTTRTDADGAFSIERPPDRVQIVVLANGFADFERPLSEFDPDRPLVIVMQPAGARENVTVSVTRSETRLSDTPASIVVLTRADLGSTAAQTIDDSLRQVAGFTLFRRSSSKTSNPTTQGVNLRGISGSGASRAEVLMDGLSLNDAFGGWTFWSRVPRIAVEQAEVFRGGASSLYGSSGLSGAIDLSSPKTSDSQPIVRMETSAGSHGTYDASLFAAASRHGWGFILAAETFQTAGYVPVAEGERGTVDRNANSRHNNGLLTIEKRFGSPRTPAEFSGRFFVRGNIFSERRDNGTSLTNNQTYFRQAAAGGDLGHKMFGTFQIRAFVETQVYDQSFSAVSADRNTESLSRLQRVPSQSTGGSVFWSEIFGPHSISASFEAREVRGFSDELGFVAGRAASVSGSGGRERTHAVFAQDIWRVNDKLNLNFGGRFDYWKNFDAHSDIRSLSTNATTVTTFADRTENSFSPRIGAIYQADQNWAFYGSYSRSFRAPTLNELYRGFRVGNVVTLSNENLRAETANTFEGGIHFTGFSRRLDLRGNIFLSEVFDPIVNITVSSAPTLITRRRENVGKTRTRGLELDADMLVRSDLHLSVSYLLADPRVTEFPQNPELVGKFLPQVARQQLNFQVAYRPLSRFSAGLQARISGGQFEDDLNTLWLRPFFTMDATVSYRLYKNVELFAAAENLFNSRYDIGLTPNRTVAAPRFVRLGLRFDLGKR